MHPVKLIISMTLNLVTKRIPKLLIFVILLIGSINLFSQETETPADSVQFAIELSEAILDSDTLVFDSLIAAKTDVNIPAVDGITPLMYAAQEGNLYFMKKLLAAGANVNNIPNNKVTALQSAVVSNRIDAVQLLIENGANLNTKNSWGESPVLSAAQNNNNEMVSMLIQAGALVNDAEADGTTLLHYATAFGNDSLVAFLLNEGANPYEKDFEGFTPLMVATSQNFNSTAELLVSYGIGLNDVNDAGFSALTIAILNGNVYLAELFLLNGADGNILAGKAKNHWYFSKGTGKYMRKVLRKSDVSRNLLPVFEDWAGGMNFGVAEKHLTTAVLFGIREKKYNLWFQTSFGLTPFVYSSLAEIYQKKYQFWERNYWITIEADKYFSLYNTYEKEWGFFAGVEAGYNFGNYRATRHKPPSYFNVIPVGGLFWRQDFTEIRLVYKKDLFQRNSKPGELGVQFHFYFGRI